MIGFFAAIASNNAMGSPSEIDGKTKTSFQKKMGFYKKKMGFYRTSNYSPA
jgi:hypothetical protein